MADGPPSRPLASPSLGEPLPIVAEPSTVRLLARRRSSPAQTLAAPGPSPEELQSLLRLGARVPDHGKLAPWRFVVIAAPAKASLVQHFEVIAAARSDAEKALAKLSKLRAAPVTICVISRADPAAAIPVWEQELSAGAVCMSLLVAAAALGYGANWITDWYAYDPKAGQILGLSEQERVAGFVHVGTPAEPPLERARPDVSSLVSYWAG